jgi:hypothetical protein
MMQTNIITDLNLEQKERQKAEKMLRIIEDQTPYDSNIFFKISQVEGKYVGSLSVSSLAMDIDVAEEDFDMENLLDVLNTQCKDRIKEWKKNRTF